MNYKLYKNLYVSHICQKIFFLDKSFPKYIFFFITANLEGEVGAAERSLEDLFIRKFIYGTFHNCLATELVLKRRANQMIISAIMLRNQSPQKYYFLIGYAEELLSHWFKCPVKLEIQIVDDKPVYKWI